MENVSSTSCLLCVTYLFAYLFCLCPLYCIFWIVIFVSCNCVIIIIFALCITRNQIQLSQVKWSATESYNNQKKIPWGWLVQHSPVFFVQWLSMFHMIKPYWLKLKSTELWLSFPCAYECSSMCVCVCMLCVCWMWERCWMKCCSVFM